MATGIAQGRLRLPGGLMRRDLALMRWMARHNAPRWLRFWMLAASRGGDGLFWCAAAVGVLLFGGNMRWEAIGSAALAASMGIFCFVTLKMLIRRPRPMALNARTAKAHRSRFWSHVAMGYRDEFSFPSGHSLTAFAVVSSLLVFYPEFGLFLLFCALSIAASRLVLGLHFLTDVVAGCLLGSALGYASVLMLFR